MAHIAFPLTIWIRSRQKLDFAFPQSDDAMLYVWGSEPDATLKPNAYLLTRRFLRDPRISIDAWYSTILANYKTVLIIAYPGYAYDYINRGSIPNGNVSWPQKSDFKIVENSFASFSATSSKSYVWRLTTWEYHDVASKTSVIWNVSAAPGNQSITELPSEILGVHPALSLTNLKHSSTTFYTESPAFESVVNSNFENGPEPAGVQLGIRIMTY